MDDIGTVDAVTSLPQKMCFPVFAKMSREVHKQHTILVIMVINALSTFDPKPACGFETFGIASGKSQWWQHRLEDW